MDVIGGRREELSGRIQQAYGVTKDEADRQITQFADKVGNDHPRTTN
jgi:uncharacterized protein YjbJ (UPF0337 family)